MKIYIVGYMGSGKSNFGSDLAEKLGYEFMDLDEVFEQKYHITVVDFFEKYGEDAFRKLESAILHSTETLDDFVISTGGGTPCFCGNMDFINANGKSIYLKLEPAVLAARLKFMKRKRPLIRDLQEKDLLPFITNHIAEREKWYCRSSIIIDGNNPDPGVVAGKIRPDPSL